MKLESIAEKDSHLPWIDGLRGIAILMVIGHHAWVNTRGEPIAPFTDAFALGLAKGVQFFFLISAFTLYGSSERRFRSDPRPVLAFYIRRGFRILPLFWVAVLAWSLLALRRHPEVVTGGQIAAELTFAFGFSPTWLNQLIPVEWSLFAEETFYFFLPLLMRHVRSLSGGIMLLMITVAVQAAWQMMTPDVFSPAYRSLFPLNHWTAFALGICLFFSRMEVKVELSATARTLADAATLLTFPWLIAQGSSATTDLMMGTLGCLQLFFVASIPGTIARRLMCWSPLRACGVACYSLYLFHDLIRAIIAPYVDQATAGLALPREARWAISAAAMTTCSLPLCLASFKYFEKPCVNLGKRLCARVARAGAAEPAARAPRSLEERLRPVHVILFATAVAVAVTLRVLPLLAPAESLIPRQLAHGTLVQRNVVYQKIDGLPLLLDIYSATDGSKASPAILFIHGGGWRSGSKELIPFYLAFVRHGYRLVSIDYRLSPKSHFPAALEDSLTALRWIHDNADRLGIDPARIGLWGASAGGHLALMVAAVADARLAPAAVCAWYPPTALAEPHLVRSLGLDVLRDFLAGAPDELPGPYRAASPVHRVRPGMAPVLLVHGEIDELVPLSQSQLMLARLKEVGASAELLAVKRARHNFVPLPGASIEPSSDSISASTVSFFDRHLKRSPSQSSQPDPEARRRAALSPTRGAGE